MSSTLNAKIMRKKVEKNACIILKQNIIKFVNLINK